MVELFRDELDLIMDELILLTDKPLSYEEHIATRFNWISTGSAGGSFVKMDGKKVRLNKPAHFDGAPGIHAV